MLKALRHRNIRRLWFGQAASSVGDEIYRVGLTWIAVGLIGADASYLSSAQAVALIVMSFIGGKWAENWDPLRTMMRVDLIRGAIVMIPVLVSFFMPTPLWLLVVTAVILSGLGAFFDPALQTVLPKFSPNAEIMQAATGLMMTTIRLARMVGPGLVGLLAGVIAPIQFFTVDAISFVVSYTSLHPLREASMPRPKAARQRISFEEAIFSGWKSLRGKTGMIFILLSKAITAGTWNLVYGLGFALLVQQMAGNDTRAFGLLIASYGLGNFAGALYFGNMRRHRPALMMFIGYIWLGIGFVVTAHCTTLNWMMVTVAVSGFSGTMNEVTFFDILQTQFPLGEIARIFRLRMASDTTATLVLMLLAPVTIRYFGVRHIIEACGAIWIITGLVGLTWFPPSD